MPRLRHLQKDPLALSALEEDRIGYHWNQISNNKRAFDDYTHFTEEEFYDFLSHPSVNSFEIGKGIGLCSLVYITSVNPYIQMVMYDYVYRVYIASTLCKIAFDQGAMRVSSFVTEDRLTAKDYVRRVGASYEGTFRKAFLRNDKYLDVEIHGIVKEDFIWQEQ